MGFACAGHGWIAELLSAQALPARLSLQSPISFIEIPGAKSTLAVMPCDSVGHLSASLAHGLEGVVRTLRDVRWS